MLDFNTISTKEETLQRDRSWRFHKYLPLWTWKSETSQTNILRDFKDFWKSSLMLERLKWWQRLNSAFIMFYFTFVMSESERNPVCV